MKIFLNKKYFIYTILICIGSLFPLSAVLDSSASYTSALCPGLISQAENMLPLNINKPSVNTIKPKPDAQAYISSGLASLNTAEKYVKSKKPELMFESLLKAWLCFHHAGSKASYYRIKLIESIRRLNYLFQCYSKEVLAGRQCIIISTSEHKIRKAGFGNLLFEVKPKSHFAYVGLVNIIQNPEGKTICCNRVLLSINSSGKLLGYSFKGTQCFVKNVDAFILKKNPDELIINLFHKKKFAGKIRFGRNVVNMSSIKTQDSSVGKLSVIAPVQIPFFNKSSGSQNIVRIKAYIAGILARAGYAEEAISVCVDYEKHLEVAIAKMYSYIISGKTAEALNLGHELLLKLEVLEQKADRASQSIYVSVLYLLGLAYEKYADSFYVHGVYVDKKRALDTFIKAYVFYRRAGDFGSKYAGIYAKRVINSLRAVFSALEWTNELNAELGIKYNYDKGLFQKLDINGFCPENYGLLVWYNIKNSGNIVVMFNTLGEPVYYQTPNAEPTALPSGYGIVSHSITRGEKDNIELTFYDKDQKVSLQERVQLKARPVNIEEFQSRTETPKACNNSA